ncbi:hypothetical protein [Massilia sp. H6]|uniref:hypothetical protein n=1 Tax=Massilia sp. H6 TaxID=2970464 RepID=UPI00216A4C44|nr:hypothetical protein [Massilia sp. H6]UVW27162.1 hypothetical protein NRS07_11345 [Massilia sp. H6]
MITILDGRAPGIATRSPARRDPGKGKVAAIAALVLLGAWHAAPLQAAARKPATLATPAVADFQRLSGTRGARAANCTAPPATAFSGLGAASLRRCAWSGHVEMLYWDRLPDSAPNLPLACLPPAAAAWHQLGAGTGLGAAIPAWYAGWTGQALLGQGAGAGKGWQHAGALWRRADGQWSAVLWRWRPSARPDTRAWQARQWSRVRAAVQAIGSASPAQPAASPLLAAWLDATRGQPRVLAGDAGRWSDAQVCLDIRTAGIGQAQVHLPYSRDDARLEQRSAMQVQLARRFPEAQWLRPFSLIEPGTPGARTGAKFFAVWKKDATLNGQVWITLRDDDGGGIVRARLSTAVPADRPPEGALADPRADELVRARALLLERELKALAHAWELRHE